MEQVDKVKVLSRSIVVLLFGLLIILLFLTFSSGSSWAADQENCMLCHRYSGISAFTPETGTKKVFYVNEHIYRNTVHGNVQCTHCHPDVKEVPHKPTKRVDCGAKCHVKEPSTEKDFSHKSIVDEFSNSSHGKSKLFRYEEGQPRCKYCHQNPTYLPINEMLTENQDIEAETLTRCMGCHEKDEWTKRFLKHFVSRTDARWGNRDIVDICNNCHASRELMDKFEVDSTENFKETFHWRNVKYDTHNGANCLRCHAPTTLDYSPHNILGADDPNSATNMAHREKTCGQADCHLAPTIPFVKGALHISGTKIPLLEEKLKEMGDDLSEEERAELTEDLKFQKTEKLKKNIIWAIKLFYKIMILLVPGSMLTHQLLDFRNTLKERKKGGHLK